MNDRNLAIQISKHPLIRKLLETKMASTSLVARLIVEEMMGEVEEDPIAQQQNKQKLERLQDTANLIARKHKVFRIRNSGDASQYIKLFDMLHNKWSLAQIAIQAAEAAGKSLKEPAAVREEISNSIDELSSAINEVDALEINISQNWSAPQKNTSEYEVGDTPFANDQLKGIEIEDVSRIKNKIFVVSKAPIHSRYKDGMVQKGKLIVIDPTQLKGAAGGEPGGETKKQIEQIISKFNPVENAMKELTLSRNSDYAGIYIKDLLISSVYLAIRGKEIMKTKKYPQAKDFLEVTSEGVNGTNQRLKELGYSEEIGPFSFQDSLFSITAFQKDGGMNGELITQLKKALEAKAPTDQPQEKQTAEEVVANILADLDEEDPNLPDLVQDEVNNVAPNASQEKREQAAQKVLKIVRTAQKVASKAEETSGSGAGSEELKQNIENTTNKLNMSDNEKQLVGDKAKEIATGEKQIMEYPSYFKTKDQFFDLVMEQLKDTTADLDKRFVLSAFVTFFAEFNPVTEGAEEKALTGVIQNISGNRKIDTKQVKEFMQFLDYIGQTRLKEQYKKGQWKPVFTKLIKDDQGLIRQVMKTVKKKYPTTSTAQNKDVMQQMSKASNEEFYELLDDLKSFLEVNPEEEGEENIKSSLSYYKSQVDDAMADEGLGNEQKEQLQAAYDKVIEKFDPSEEEAVDTPTDEPAEEDSPEPIDVPPVDKAAVEKYTKEYKRFKDLFLKVPTLKEQSEIFYAFHQIVLRVAGKDYDEIVGQQLKAISRTAQNVQPKEKEPELQAEQEENQEQQPPEEKKRAIILSARTIARHVKAVSSILDKYDKYLEDVTVGSRELFDKFGEKDPKKVLYKFVKLLSNDIDSMVKKLDETIQAAGGSEKEPVNEQQEEELSLLQKIEKVEEVHTFVVEDGNGQNLLNAISEYADETKDKEVQKEQEENPEIPTKPGEMAAKPGKEVYANYQDLASAIADQLETIANFFPTARPFNSKYTMQKAKQSFSKVVEKLEELVANIQGFVSDQDITTESLKEFKERLLAIREVMQSVFGISPAAKKSGNQMAYSPEGEESGLPEAKPVDFGIKYGDQINSAPRLKALLDKHRFVYDAAKEFLEADKNLQEVTDKEMKRLEKDMDAKSSDLRAMLGAFKNIDMDEKGLNTLRTLCKEYVEFFETIEKILLRRTDPEYSELERLFKEFDKLKASLENSMKGTKYGHLPVGLIPYEFSKEEYNILQKFKDFIQPQPEKELQEVTSGKAVYDNYVKKNKEKIDAFRKMLTDEEKPILDKILKSVESKPRNFLKWLKLDPDVISGEDPKEMKTVLKLPKPEEVPPDEAEQIISQADTEKPAEQVKALVDLGYASDPDVDLTTPTAEDEREAKNFVQKIKKTNPDLEKQKSSLTATFTEIAKKFTTAKFASFVGPKNKKHYSTFVKFIMLIKSENIQTEGLVSSTSTALQRNSSYDKDKIKKVLRFLNEKDRKLLSAISSMVQDLGDTRLKKIFKYVDEEKIIPPMKWSILFSKTDVVTMEDPEALKDKARKTLEHLESVKYFPNFDKVPGFPNPEEFFGMEITAAGYYKITKGEGPVLIDSFGEFDPNKDYSHFFSKLKKKSSDRVIYYVGEKIFNSPANNIFFITLEDFEVSFEFTDEESEEWEPPPGLNFEAKKKKFLDDKGPEEKIARKLKPLIRETLKKGR